MSSPEEHEPQPRRLSTILLGLALIGGFVALPFVRPPDGHEHAAIVQFFGRFHPLLVHGPIALLLLVPLLEIAGLFHPWEYFRATAGPVLWIATAGALVATVAGWMLAWAGGYQGEQVMNHLWGGVALASSCLVLVWLRKPYAAREGFLSRLLYLPLLLGTIILMAWTSHQGSVITHGDDFLTKYMPTGLRSLLGVADAPAPKDKPAATTTAAGSTTAVVPVAPTLFTTQIAPIIEKNCVSCHKPSKHKGGLRMDTYALIMQGGEDGPIIVPGDLKKSELYRRITLPAADDDFMPTDGKPALKPAEIELLAQWITAGAKP